MISFKKKFFLVLGLVILSTFSIINLNLFTSSNLSHRMEFMMNQLHVGNSLKLFNRSITSFDPKISYPWSNDSTCKHFVVQLKEKNSLPKWPLTSFPGSGVTFTRQLIEGITGIYTGSVYLNDPSPVLSKENKSDRTDDPLCGCTIIDKDHEATITDQGIMSYFNLLHREGHAGIVHQQYDNRGVLLLRNPMDVVFTYCHWIHGGKTGKAKPEYFRGPVWDEIVDYVAYAWADHAIRWIEQIKIGTVLFYERLISNRAENELMRFLNVMEFEPINPLRMKCALSHRNRTDHMRLNKSQMFLEAKHRKILMQSIHRVQQSLRRKGWPRLPIYLYNIHSPNGKL